MLLELDLIQDILPLVDEYNYKRTCEYLMASAQYAGNKAERDRIFKVCFDIFKAQKVFPEALRVAMKLHDASLLQPCFEECTDPGVRNLVERFDIEPYSDFSAN